MNEVSREEVEAVVNSIKESQDSLDIGSLTAKTDILDSVILILKDCWNTTSGREKQKRLKEIADSNLELSKIESCLNSVKETTISYSTVTQSTSYH